ncbi:MAG: hypothetical protein F6K55_03280 [Moorea sp. SIO4A3]|nr:hypothetical protein [Moorena sp. SIO4A3]
MKKANVVMLAVCIGFFYLKLVNADLPEMSVVVKEIEIKILPLDREVEKMTKNLPENWEDLINEKQE